MNQDQLEKVKAAFWTFARDVGVAFVAFLLALAAVFNLVPQAQDSIGVQGLQPQKFNVPVVFNQGATFNGAVSATVISRNGTPVFWATAIPTPTSVISNTKYVVCNTTTITGTGTIAHGLATPSYITYGLAQDATGDGARVSHTNSAATVTLKVWNTALTPAAATTPVAVDWCAVGTK